MPFLRDTGRLEGGLCEDCGGLPQEDGAGDRSCTGRGDMGTFHMKASSGTSSSSSSHSASRSLVVFRAPACQDCLRGPIADDGDTSRVRDELFRERVRGAEVYDCDFAGEGVRDRRVGAARVAREGAEGDEKPRLLLCFPGACSCDCEREALLTWPLRLGYRGFEPPVRSRKE
jgi:hypothetical protein